MVEKKYEGGGSESMRRAIMGVIIIVVIGYFLMWILMPTNLYNNHWSPKIRAHTHSTFFGDQGATILMYTFPVLFISILGCVYLHLPTRLDEPQVQRKTNDKLASWKRPLIIKGLGIVTWIELTFTLMFIALLLWTFFNFLHFFATIKIYLSSRAHNMWEVWLARVGLVLGIVGNVCLTFLFFPVSRGSSLLGLFGLTSDGCIKYHIWLGHVTMAIFTAHGLLYIIYWLITNQPSKMLEWNKIHVSNVAGELSLVFGLMLWVTTYPKIRRTMFEVFFYVHYLYILFIVFFVFHLGISYACIMLPGFYLFVVDRCLRMLQSTNNIALVSARVLSGQTIELNFSKTPGLSYSPTSIIFMNVPTISKLQWHPFTISSNSNMDPQVLSVVVKGAGTWTHKLYRILASTQSIDRLNVSLEGPYGPSSTPFLQHDALVMVSGGSGVSPFISIIREFIFRTSKLKHHTTSTPNLFLVAAFKNSSDLTMLDLLTPLSNDTHTNYLPSNLNLEIHAYVTRETTATTTTSPVVRTVWFKPNASDAPISPTLGRNSWLWLGVVITFSFVIYLVLMGILTRFYIYPIDHNTNRIYSNSWKAAFDMMLICMSIVTMASAAFLWNKKQNAMEAKEFHDSRVERDLENVPCKSLVRATTIQYGRRPDLKKIILDRKEASVGVLVCGPKQMRHDVANICSSTSAQNLHFECISFTW